MSDFRHDPTAEQLAELVRMIGETSPELLRDLERKARETAGDFTTKVSDRAIWRELARFLRRVAE